MSKNFELLQSITDEKGLFETLDDWEQTAGAATEPNAEEEGKASDKAVQKTSLPDVFRAVTETLGPLDSLTLELDRNSEAREESARAVESDRREARDRTFEERFPISRNPITQLDSSPAAPPWVGPDLGPETGPDLSNEVEVEFGQELLRSMAVPDTPPTTERTAGSGHVTVPEPRPAKEEKSHREPPTPEVPHREPPASTRMGQTKPSGESSGEKVRARGVYKDSKRELIAREEESKLVQRIFLGGEQDSPRIALFSGVERDGGCAGICARAGELLAAQTESSVCLVDADFRALSLHEYFGAQNNRGLADAALESAPIQQFAQQLTPANLWLIPGGYGASQLNFAKVADRLRARVEELRGVYRYVILHSGPLWLNANAMLLTKWTDGVVLVLEANSTRRDTARRIKEGLAVANAKMLGVVLNNRTYPIPESLYSRL